MTRQRALILEILQHSPKHLTADEIFAIAKEQAREIARLEMPDGPDRFDKTSNPHGHLYCDCCGSLQDLPVIGLVREIENAIGTEVRSYQLTIHYICPECREKQAEL